MNPVTQTKQTQIDYFFFIPKTKGEAAALAALAGLACFYPTCSGIGAALYLMHKIIPIDPSNPEQKFPQITLRTPNPYYHPNDLAINFTPSAVAKKLHQELKKALVFDKNDESNPDFLKASEKSVRFPVTSQIEHLSARKKVGVAHAQGPRPTMEDAHIARTCTVEINGKSISYDLFGIIDGHGGSQTAEFVSQHLHEEINASLEKHGLSDVGIFTALKEAFVQIDARIKETVKEPSGAVAVVSLKIGNCLWTANLGDSRAILKTEKVYLPLSEDAKPDAPRFQKGIEARGGWVSIPEDPTQEVSRVNGRLAAARAFNDACIRGEKGHYAVSPRPKITKIDLADLPKEGAIFLIQACDGIWDVASTLDVAKLADSTLPISKIAEQIVSKALNSKTGDNCSALVYRIR